MAPSPRPSAVVGETTLSRGIDYLGSIARLLRDLSGFSTLVYELLQNADDAPGATAVRFDVTPEALVVWNDGRFQDCGRQDLPPDLCPWRTERGERCDFHRFRSVSAGDKGRRADLTGAFGIGFTAVYQVTDQPEIISSGQHWIIDETRQEHERITAHTFCPICDGEAGTRFILPWAMDSTSDFRSRTNMPAVDPTDAEKLIEVLERVVPTAMLFLRKIRTVVILKQSQSIREITRVDDGEDTLINDGDTDQAWRVIRGDFEAEAQDLRDRYPSKLDKSADIAIAVPYASKLEGRLCAYLPTEERTGLPFHVNADFFPVSDRKRLIIEGYQGEWNRTAIRKAAMLLAERLVDLREVCQHRQLWSLLVDAHQASTNPLARTRDLSLESFWAALEPSLRTAAVLWTNRNQWVAPGQAFIVKEPEEVKAAEILAALGGVFAHPDLREYCLRLPSLGLTQLSINDLVNLLLQNRLDHRTTIGALPEPLQAASSRDILLGELERLLERAPLEVKRSRESIARVAIAPGADGAVWPWADTFRADGETRALFGRFAGGSVFLQEDMLPEESSRIISLAPTFKAGDAISWLAGQQPEEVVSLLERDIVNGRALLEWFEDRKSELAEEPALGAQLAELPLFPTRDTFRPLTDLALPGDFIDDLGLADLVDVKRVGDALPLLRRLGNEPLTFSNYVIHFVPRAVGLSQTDPARWWNLVQVMAGKLGEIEDNAEAKSVLAGLPCVRTTAGLFVNPGSVYFASDMLERVLGDYSKAYVPTEHQLAVATFYRWLGVETDPRAADVLNRIRRTTAVPPTDAGRTTIANIVDHLASKLRAQPFSEWGPLSVLANSYWLPAREDSSRWHAARELYTTFQDYLFWSQARFVGLPVDVQRSAVSFLEAAGVRSAPTTGQIVAHLLRCSDAGQPIKSTGL